MIKLSEKVKFLIAKLEKSGFSAYCVGGCVRDSLLSKNPEDWDIATSASPDEVMKIFEKTVPTGIKHGTVTVLLDGEPFELTTFRKDGEYKDSRHPENVSFTDDIKEDLARRDFTINAMAYSEKKGLIDPFGGREDLKKGIIRCVGEPAERFTEDALRMMRAVRFSAQLGFLIEEKTLSAIEKCALLVKNVSAERIKIELDKIVMSKNPAKIKILYETGLLEHIIPELCLCFRCEQNIKYHIYDVGNHTMKVLENVPPHLPLRYAALFHDLGKPAKKTTDDDGVDHFKGHAEISVELSDDIMSRLKFDNSTKDKVKRLVHHHDREILAGKKYVKRAIQAVGDDIFCDLMYLKVGDAKGQNPALVSERFIKYDEILKIYKDIKENNEPFSIKNLAIDGNDLKDMGLLGKEIGNALSASLEFVIENPSENTKEKLLKYVKNMIKD